MKQYFFGVSIAAVLFAVATGAFTSHAQTIQKKLVEREVAFSGAGGLEFLRQQSQPVG